MKYMKMLELLAIAAAALMAFAGPASAKLTEGTGDAVEAGEVIHADAEGRTMFGLPIDVNCSKSTLGGTVSAAGGTIAPLSTLTFTECSPDTVTVIKKGLLTFGSDHNVFSTGAEITVQVHRTVLGFPVTSHCTLLTNNTNVGSLTESDAAGHPMSTIDISSSGIPVIAATSGSSCGPTAVWEVSYTVTTPAFLAID